jgi:hypothetical protein
MTETGSRLAVGAGTCGLIDAFEAGKSAATDAVAQLRGAEPSLILVFCTPRFDLPALLAGIRSVTGSTLLVGGTGSGEIVGGKYLGFGGGLGVLALSAGPYKFAAASAGDITGSLDEVGQALARRSRDQAGPSAHSAALLITDSLLGDLQQFVRGVYRVTGPRVAFAGGAAGDEQRFVQSSVFHDDKVLHKGALVLWIASDRPLKIVTRHGWLPLSAPLLVTRAEGTEISELGGRSAALAYEEQLGLTEPLKPEQFWGTSIWHPFGLLQPDGTHVIRVARTKTERGTLMIQGCVPTVGSAVQVMRGSVDSLLDVTEEVVEAALADAGEPSVLLAFSCAARAMIYRDRAPEEAARLQAAAGDIPTFGFYCCAEFARTAGVLGTHNATLTALAL